MLRRLTFPNEIHSGPGALDKLQEIPGRRVLLVADPFLTTLGVVDRAAELLRRGDRQVDVFDGVIPDPNRGSCEQAAAIAGQLAPDLIVALGGGSAIDTAKTLWVKYEHPELDWQQLTTFFALPPLRQKARLVAIPTTIGTGSEVSYAAMVTNETAELPIKECILGYDLCPDVVIADPTLTLSVPPNVTAWTGFDVLSHALEAAVSRFACDVTVGLASRALRLVVRWLPVAYADGSNLEARDHLQQASLLAGMAMASAALGVMHSLAHALGTTFHYHHGLACAYAMTQTIGFNSPVVADGYAELARTALGVDVPEPSLACRRLVAVLDDLKRKVNIPLSLQDAGVNTEKFVGARGQLVRLASLDANRPSNPRDYTDDNLERLLLGVWLGTVY
ncbi:MAG TPA: iron-containing alcohol dehydrogenase [Chloroflexota bacterium]|nr:iron-containing alcohol dehydrogenase [Chloroflexota bacterium]